MAEHVHRRETTDLSLVGRVAQALRERAPQRYLMMEQYGPDGEIEEATECWPLTEEDSACDAVQAVVIRRPDEHGHHPDPKSDWRERGIIPPRGFHRYQWRQ